MYNEVAAEQVDRYLLRLRIALGDTPGSDKTDIVAEIRSHILDRLATGTRSGKDLIQETLAALGSPESLAAAYESEGLLKRAATSSSPVLIARATLRWAMTGVRGFCVFLILLTGYSTSAALYACALLKPFFPDRVGLWFDPPFVSMGFRTASAAPVRELLGSGLIPVGLMFGTLCLIGTTRFVRWLIRRSGSLGKAIVH